MNIWNIFIIFTTITVDILCSTTCRKSDTFITFIQSYPTRKVGLTVQLAVRLVLCERYSTIFERGNKQ